MMVELVSNVGGVQLVLNKQLIADMGVLTVSRTAGAAPAATKLNANVTKIETFFMPVLMWIVDTPVLGQSSSFETSSGADANPELAGRSGTTICNQKVTFMARRKRTHFVRLSGQKKSDKIQWRIELFCRYFTITP